MFLIFIQFTHCILFYNDKSIHSGVGGWEFYIALYNMNISLEDINDW